MDEKASLTMSLADGITNGMESVYDNMTLWPDWTLLFQLPIIITSGVLGIASLILAIPVAISEVVYSSVRDELIKGNFTEKYVYEAQKQIAEVKIADYFRQKLCS